MNINEHPIYKNICDLCQQIEELPASPQQTKIVIMAGELEKPVRYLLALVKQIKTEALFTNDAPTALARIVRLSIDAGIPSETGVQKFNPENPSPLLDVEG